MHLEFPEPQKLVTGNRFLTIFKGFQTLLLQHGKHVFRDSEIMVFFNREIELRIVPYIGICEGRSGVTGRPILIT